VDSDLAQSLAARIFADESKAIANHSVRSYLFATEFAGAIAAEAGVDYDDRLLLAACLLHDIGLTKAADGDQRFEIDGADYATDLLSEHDFSTDEARAVWEAIVLHTSPGIAERWNPLTRLVRSGVGMDFGRGLEVVPADRIDAIFAGYPRLDMEATLVAEVIAQADANPLKAPRNSFAEILQFERTVQGITRLEAGAITR
jgi:hypothetical protein